MYCIIIINLYTVLLNKTTINYYYTMIVIFNVQLYYELMTIEEMIEMD